MSISINYQENVRYLTKNEWTNIINHCISKIKSTEVGNLLISNINSYSSCGHQVKITNYSRNKSFQYPNMSFCNNNGKYEISICIPDTPYFTKVPIMSPYLKDLKDIDINIKNIYNYQEIQNKIANEFVKSFAIYQFQPIVVVLFHELVHALRVFKGIHTEDSEEEAAIYGIVGNSLFLNGKLVTENTFRKEIGLLPRISHDAQYMHVYGTSDLINNKSKEFWKSAFKKIVVNV